MTLPSFPGGAPALSRTHRLFPTPQTGYRINGKFSICLPLGADTPNLVTNPSLETNSTGYALSGGATIARTTLKQRRGAWSLAITPGAGAFDGAFFGTVPTVGSTVYTFDCDVLGAAGVDYRIYVASTAGGAISGYYQFKGLGRWQRVSVTYQENTAPGVATNRRLYLTKAGGASTIPFYWDGLKVTATPFPTTYFDGDSRGFVPGRTDFYWTGTAHGSTSVMSGQTRAGGKLIPLANFGFTLLAMLGLGMTPLNNIAIPLAAGGGAFFQTIVEQDRSFDLVGALTGRSLQELQRRRHDLIAALRPDNVPFDQPLLLRYQPTDDCGNPNGHELDIICAYESGLAGATNNHYQENIDLRFHIYLPFAAREDGWNGATLGYQNAPSAATDWLLTRSPGGVWSKLSANGAVLAFVDGQDGNIYIGGAFTQLGTVLNTNRIGYYTPGTGAYSAMGSGGNGNVQCLARSPDGGIWAGGNFTIMGGVANTSQIAKWLNGAWLSAGNSNGTILAIVSDRSGLIYAGGSPTVIGGTAVNNIGSYNGTNWSAVGNPGGTVRALAIGPDGTLYAGIDNVGLKKWTGAAWVTIGAIGGTDFIYSLVFGPDGMLYVLGKFANIGALTGVNNVARYNGTALSAMGTGVLWSGGTAGVVNGVIQADGSLLVIGNFDILNGVAGPIGMGIWNGSAWDWSDLLFNSSLANFASLARTTDGSLFGGVGTVASLTTSSAVTPITNTGVVKAFPRLTLTGPGSVYQLKNYSTGRTVYFNLTLNAGEIAVLDFSDPQNVQFSSNFRPNLLGTILAGSSLDFFLMPGTNQVSLFIGGTVNANTAAVIAWRNTYHSVDSAINLSVVN